jgi:hypothetical protein
MSSFASGQIAIIGIDIGKNSFHIVGLDKRAAILLPARDPTSPFVFEAEGSDQLRSMIASTI